MIKQHQDTIGMSERKGSERNIKTSTMPRVRSSTINQLVLILLNLENT
jgi:hypothetical protein